MIRIGDYSAFNLLTVSAIYANCLKADESFAHRIRKFLSVSKWMKSPLEPLKQDLSIGPRMRILSGDPQQNSLFS